MLKRIYEQTVQRKLSGSQHKSTKESVISFWNLNSCSKENYLEITAPSAKRTSFFLWIFLSGSCAVTIGSVVKRGIEGTGGEQQKPRV